MFYFYNIDDYRCTYTAEDRHAEIFDVNNKEEINEGVEENIDILNEEIEESVTNKQVYEQNNAYELFNGA